MFLCDMYRFYMAVKLQIGLSMDILHSVVLSSSNIFVHAFGFRPVPFFGGPINNYTKYSCYNVEYKCVQICWFTLLSLFRLNSDHQCINILMHFDTGCLRIV